MNELNICIYSNIQERESKNIWILCTYPETHTHAHIHIAEALSLTLVLTRTHTNKPSLFLNKPSLFLNKPSLFLNIRMRLSISVFFENVIVSLIRLFCKRGLYNRDYHIFDFTFSTHSHSACHSACHTHALATISRLLKITGLFCRISSLW